MAKRNRQEVLDRREEKKSQSLNKGSAANDYRYREVHAPVQAKTIFQKELLRSLKTKPVTVASGSAGVGKSFVVMSEVSDWLKRNEIDKIVLSRPSVGMGNTLGLLPGGIREKFEPFLSPLVNVVVERYGQGFYETALNNKKIEFVPLEYARGRSWDNAVVIIDEMQNVKPEEAYTILTRLGENSKMILIGDMTQNDLRGQTGIEWVIDFVDNHELYEYVGIVEGTSDDIVRSGFCKAVVQAREKELKRQS